MPFTLNFNSNINTEILDVSVLEPFARINESIKIDSIIFDSEFNQPIPKLPTCIKNVKFGYNFNQDISNIGDHIESIIFEVADFNYNLSTFPKGLRDLKIDSYKISSRIENINSGLENLTILNNTFNDEIKLANTNIKSLKINSYVFNRSLQGLPPGLKSLEIDSEMFNSPLDELPAGLEYLKMSSPCRIDFKQSIDNLPPGLKTLILENFNLSTQSLNNLPHGLEYLNLFLGYHDDIIDVNKCKQTLEHLPNSIIKMVLSNFWGDLNTIGDGVVELDIWFPRTSRIPHNDICTHIQHWKKLPSSLKILDINKDNDKDTERVKYTQDIIDIIKTNINCNGIYINGKI